ncbi:hypothetical protein G7046_g4162 [Stylonectria norvegica]|nr:hypothetical protein G7046_g4162 [Stylonectria norvegica]
MPLQCQFIYVSLISVGSPRQCLDDTLAVAPTSKPVQPQRASVLHLANYCDVSFVDVALVRELFSEKYGPDVPMPHIDNDTRVQLQWSYPSLDETEVTKHRVLRDSRYQIILRKQDWLGPIRSWLQLQHQEQYLDQQQQQEIQEQQQQLQRLQLQEAETQQQHQDTQGSTHRSCSQTTHASSSASETIPSASTQPATVVAPPSPEPSDFEDSSDSGDDFAWSEMEIVETEPTEAAGDAEKNESAFWTFSREHHNWFHRDEDGTIMWFQLS